MTTIILTASEPCSGGEHFTVSVTGDVSRTVRTSVSGVMGPLTEDDQEAFVRVLLKLAKVTRTKTQLRGQLTTGLTITI